MPPREYNIAVPQSVLDDLRDRLSRTRWPHSLVGAEWDYGANVEYVRELCRYWAEEYDWREHESRLNAYPQFLCEIDGVDLHYWHIKGKGPDHFPLLLLHGWPGSPYEFLHELVGPLSDPAAHGGDAADAFDLIIPSLPGYGFGGQPAVRGWGAARVADAFHTLMTVELGYERFGSQGGDWGAMISANMASRYPADVAGIHINFVFLPGPFGGVPRSDPETTRRLQAFDAREGAYAHLHSTKPDSLTIAQSDSPAGLAAWIVEKFRAWSDCGGDVESAYSKDTLLTNIMFYWAPNSVASAARLYYESHADEERNFGFPKVEVPTGVAHFPGDPFNRPRDWAEEHYTIARWTDMPRGGHFPALEQPELLGEDVRSFFRTIRTQER